MKKIITVLALAAFFGGISLQASPVSSEKALDIARKIFDAQKVKRAAPGEVKIVWNGEFEADAAKRDAAQPAFYVVARDGGGWVMVAGDDNVRPVLGLSADGIFESENMPDNVKWWMERIKAYVRSTSVPDPEAIGLWAKFVDTKADNASISGEISNKFERITPEWDQGNNDMYYFGEYVFNAMCPRDNNQNLCITGCVAVALGEIMTYESGQFGDAFPTSGTGSVGGYEVGANQYAPASYELSAVYDWAGLRTLTDISAIRGASAELRANLGRLLADLGAIAEASYSVNGTGANTAASVGHMIDHFGINKAACFEDASGFTPRQWVNKLKNELDERPVLYSGRTQDDRNGHAFVLDGYGEYEGETVFHVNFGWAGSGNGYYYITDLDSGNGDYSYSCAAAFGFYPDADSAYQINLSFINLNWTIGGRTIPSYGLANDGIREYGVPSYLLLGVMNHSYGPYNGEIWIGREKVDSTKELLFKVYDSTEKGPLLSYYYATYSIRVGIGGDQYSFGEHLAVFYSTDESRKVFEKIPTPDSGEYVGEIPLLKAPFIKTESSYSVGDPFIFRLMNIGTRFAGTVWTITNPDGIAVTMNQSDIGFDFAKAGKYKIEAAVAETVGGPVVETIVTYITVGNN